MTSTPRSSPSASAARWWHISAAGTATAGRQPMPAARRPRRRAASSSLSLSSLSSLVSLSGIGILSRRQAGSGGSRRLRPRRQGSRRAHRWVSHPALAPSHAGRLWRGTPAPGGHGLAGAAAQPPAGGAGAVAAALGAALGRAGRRRHRAAIQRPAPGRASPTSFKLAGQQGAHSLNLLCQSSLSTTP